MIRELFLPDSIKGYYLFAKRIVGFDVGKTHVRAAQIYVHGRSTVIEKYVELQLEPGAGNNYNERATAALKLLTEKLDRFDVAYSSLSSSVAIFKELKLPFLTYDKIKMVVQYEIEPLLPFSINDAVIDFIITKTHPQEGSSEILVAAVQNQHIINHLHLFQGTGIDPEIIFIDLFALYELYKKMPSYASLQGNIVLIDLGLQTTRMAYLQNGQLRFIRSLNKGIWNVAKSISEATNMQPQETMDHILRYGLEHTVQSRNIQERTQAFTDFWQEIQFTLQSFSAQTSGQALNKILLLGEGADIKFMPDFVSSLLHLPTSLLLVSDLLRDPSITVKNKTSLPSTSCISLATAIPSPLTETFNLRQGEFAASKNIILTRQLITGALLLMLMFGSLLFFVFWQINKFKNANYSSQQEALNALKNRVNLRIPIEDATKKVKEEKKLSVALDTASDTVKKQEQMWFAFAGPARATTLKYLLELTTRIDKDALGFDIHSLSIAQGVMTIHASVKSHEALRILEKELKQSKLFSGITSPEDTTFTMKINLSKNGEETP